METELHRALKNFYAAVDGRVEVRVGRYRVDVVRDGRLLEIQHGSLAALRGKLRDLVLHHDVTVIKPIIARKMLVVQDARTGRVIRRRRSPKRGTLLDIFDELVYLRGIYPHPRLTLELVLVDMEEWRRTARGRRRSRHGGGFRVEQQKLLRILGCHRFRTAGDLANIVSVRLPDPFHTGHLARGMNIERWAAQRIAYCLRYAGAVQQVGKLGNSLLYRFADQSRAA